MSFLGNGTHIYVHLPEFVNFSFHVCDSCVLQCAKNCGITTLLQELLHYCRNIIALILRLLYTSLNKETKKIMKKVATEHTSETLLKDFSFCQNMSEEETFEWNVDIMSTYPNYLKRIQVNLGGKEVWFLRTMHCCLSPVRGLGGLGGPPALSLDPRAPRGASGRVAVFRPRTATDSAKKVSAAAFSDFFGQYEAWSCHGHGH